jgi:selenocysteine lyase/cysteine desulfurase
MTQVDRRRFLAGGALLAGTVALGGCTGVREGAAPPTATPEPEPADLSTWEAVRAQFALDPQFAHFGAFVLASHPAPVRAAIERWRQALDTDPVAVAAEESAQEERVRAAAAAYLRVRADEIALTDSTTMGLGLVYHGLRLRRGDHVLTTTHDFYSTHESLRLVAAGSGAEVEQVPLYADPATASAGEIVSRVRAAVRPNTRVVAVTWVHSGTGVKLPIRAIADALAEVNARRDPAFAALLCVDAIHGLGAEDTGPAELGCDVFISGTHKWLFGPRGTGLVWAARERWDAVAPVIPTFTGPSIGRWIAGEEAPYIFGLDATPGGYHSFEHRWALAEAFDFHAAIGRDRIAARTRELATRLKDGLAGLPGVRLVTPRDPELSAGIVCCEVTGSPAPDVVERLRREHGILATVTPYREQYVRFGTSVVTTPEQVDAAVAALA